MPLFHRLGAFLSGRDEAGDNGNRNQHDYHAKTNGRGNLEKGMSHDHLDTDEDQNQRSPNFELDESVHEICQQEVHGTQAQNCKGITSEN